MKVLIVEDDELSQTVLKDIILLLYPFVEVETVGNGKEALNLFSSKKIDLVISDIALPEIGGIELLKKIKEKNPSVPIIAYTAFTIIGDKEKFLLEGFDDYIPKPINIEDVKNALDKYIKKRKTFNIKVYKTKKEFELLEKGNYLLFLTEGMFKNLTSTIDKFLNKKVKIAGIMAPYLIANRELIKEGVILVPLDENAKTVVVSMEKPDLNLVEELKDYQSILLFVDGLSPYIEDFIKQIEKILKNSRIVGAGVGSKDFIQKPCIFDFNGTYQDSALLIGLNLKLNAEVRHGWEPIYGPLVVTKSEKNVVYEINGEPAFQVYKKSIKEKEGIELNRENFKEFTKAYPLGMVSFKDDEFIIRDPIAIGKNNSLVIVSSIPSFSTIFIMKGEPEKLINSACEISRRAFQRSKEKLGFLFDCVSRVLFLGKDGFQKELDKVFECAKKKEVDIYGFTSIGEISNIGYDEIRIFNKTILLGIL
ncbi:response regulator [Thermodesulfobacterium sp. TA1]|uniref:response regulator n=1 Tax=Thermodesulfobacterium sp. TA1 TaxID=2234087 RepID=UPI00143E09FE|nr:response regulator [Thermodesulfobacterium sp. TA1]